MRRTERVALAGAVLVAALSATLGGGGPDVFETDVDLDGVNGPESLVQIYRSANDANGGWPNVVCVGLINRVQDASFVFDWPRAGPGGFYGQTAPGTAAGTGVIWRWDTIGQVCANACNPVDGDCLTWSDVETPDSETSLDLTGLTTTVCQGGSVPGQACITDAGCGGGTCAPCGQVANVSDAGLISSMHAVFGAGGGGLKRGATPSVPAPSSEISVELLRVESRVQPVAGGGFLTRTKVVNLSNTVLGFELDGSGFGELACGPNEVRCGDVCCAGSSCSLDLCNGLTCAAAPADCAPPGTVCDGVCVDTQFDELHCGGCNGAGGVACLPPTGCCVDGACTVCPSEGQPVVLRPGEEAEICQGSVHPARETLSRIAAFCDPSDGAPCSVNEPGIRGMVNVLVPDTSVTIPTDAPFLTPVDVLLTDGPGGDGRAQPGETVELTVTLNNAGAVAVPPGAQATLISPQVCDGGSGHGFACTTDLDCPDGRCPKAIPRATSVYAGGVPAGPGPLGDAPPSECDQPRAPLPMGTNDTSFSVSIPLDHVPNTTRTFEMSFRICEGGDNPGDPCRTDGDCENGVCRAICSDGAGTCVGDADCSATASCIDPVASFPLAIRCCGTVVKGAPQDPVGCAALFDPPLHLALNRPVMVWSAVGDAYDVVGGDLANLRDGGWIREGEEPPLNAQCLVADNPVPFARFTRLCVGGSEGGRVCTDNGDCPGGTCQCLEGDACVSDPANTGDGLWFLIRDPGPDGYGGPPERDAVLPDCS